MSCLAFSCLFRLHNNMRETWCNMSPFSSPSSSHVLHGIKKGCSKKIDCRRNERMKKWILLLFPWETCFLSSSEGECVYFRLNNCSQCVLVDEKARKICFGEFDEENQVSREERRKKSMPWISHSLHFIRLRHRNAMLPSLQSREDFPWVKSVFGGNSYFIWLQENDE